MKKIILSFQLIFVATTSSSQAYEFQTFKENNCTPVISHGITGTCGSFSTTSFLESEIIRLTEKPIDLSEIYTVQNTYPIKAKNYLYRLGKAIFVLVHQEPLSLVTKKQCSCIMEPIIFKSSIHWTSGILLTVVSFFIVLMPFLGLLFEDLNPYENIAAVVVLLIGMCMFWMLLDTKYTFKGEYLYYCSGPIRGKIRIDSIRAIEHQKGWYCKSFLKPSLGYNGLYVYYNKFDDIYLSPKDKPAFVNYLLTTNPKILIKDNKPV